MPIQYNKLYGLGQIALGNFEMLLLWPLEVKMINWIVHTYLNLVCSNAWLNVGFHVVLLPTILYLKCRFHHTRSTFPLESTWKLTLNCARVSYDSVWLQLWWQHNNIWPPYWSWAESWILSLGLGCMGMLALNSFYAPHKDTRREPHL